MYASWGIDYLKYDLCYFIPDVMMKQAPNDKAAQMKLMIAAYAKMGKALKATGHELLCWRTRLGWNGVMSGVRSATVVARDDAAQLAAGGRGKQSNVFHFVSFLRSGAGRGVKRGFHSSGG